MTSVKLDTLTVYFDGNCPLCLAEIHVLKNNNRQQLLQFIDLNNPDDVDQAINCSLAMQTIHAQLGNGAIIKGPAVFEEAYKRSDLKVMKVLFSFKLFQVCYGLFYIVFARFRHTISKLIGPRLLTLAQTKYPNHKP